MYNINGAAINYSNLLVDIVFIFAFCLFLGLDALFILKLFGVFYELKSTSNPL